MTIEQAIKTLEHQTMLDKMMQRITIQASIIVVVLAIWRKINE